MMREGSHEIQVIMSFLLGPVSGALVAGGVSSPSFFVRYCGF